MLLSFRGSMFTVILHTAMSKGAGDMKTPIVLTFALIAAGISAAQAQKPAVTGGAVVASEPGKAAAVATAEITATVVSVDKATRTITLKGPQRTVDLVAGDEVRNFDQI